MSTELQPVCSGVVPSKTNCLDRRLGESLSEEMKLGILSTFGKRVSTSSISTDLNTRYGGFIRYYETECRRATRDLNGFLETHEQLIDVISVLSENKEESQDSIRQLVRSKLGNTLHADSIHSELAAIALGLRLCLMVNVQPSINSLPSSASFGKTASEWDDQIPTLDNFIASIIPKADYSSVDVTFSQVFNCANLSIIGGISIFWTDNLADHLLYHPRHKRLDLFKFASFLLDDHGTPHTFYEKEFLQETCQTLSLLFPFWDDTSIEFLKQHQEVEDLDSSLVNSIILTEAPTDASKYFYWRDRLLLLKTALDNARPSGFLSLWKDRRNEHQWWTFWIAVVVFLLTVIFGTISSVTGILQVYASFKNFS